MLVKKNNDLLEASINGNLSRVQELLKTGVDVNYQNNDGVTALMNSAFNYNKEIFVKLVEAGADVNIKNVDQDTAIFYTILAPNLNIEPIASRVLGYEVEERLGLDHSHINYVLPSENKTNMEIVCDMVKLLIEVGVDINHQNKYGYTPLHIATYYNYEKILDLLIKAKANLDLQDEDGKTALMFAAENNLITVTSLLVAGDANVNILDNNDDTALLKAIVNGNHEIVDILIQGGVDVNKKNKFGMTPLKWAKIVLEGSDEREVYELIIETLIKNGAN